MTFIPRANTYLLYHHTEILTEGRDDRRFHSGNTIAFSLLFPYDKNDTPARKENAPNDLAEAPCRLVALDLCVCVQCTCNEKKAVGIARQLAVKRRYANSIGRRREQIPRGVLAWPGLLLSRGSLSISTRART